MKAKLQLTIIVTIVSLASAATAQSPGDSNEIRAQIEALRAEQSRIAEQQRSVDEKLRALEARLAPQVAPVAAVSQGGPDPVPQARLKVTGDLRLRAQGDYGDGDRESGQVRARLGARYALSERATVGARLVTGDPDDPNSTDVNLSNFDDDFQVSLDQAYLQYDFGDLKLYGGKLPQPFTVTDLVWDGDVNPQGLSAVYKHTLPNGGAFRANGLFFLVDEQTAGPESTMAGAQLGYDSPALGQWKVDLSAAYYDYGLQSTAGSDSGDWRSNALNPDGSYLSDFDLGDVIVGATWAGLGERWPLRVVGDYVKNFGARVDADSGYGLDLMLGRLSKAGDWRATYGYSRAETDAVLAAFSHDNTTLGTNYQLHAFTLNYMVTARSQVTGIWYHYKAKDAGDLLNDDWLERFRVLLQVSF